MKANLSKIKLSQILFVHLMAFIFATMTAFATSTEKPKTETTKGEKKMSEVYAVFNTTEGTFKARLFADKAPNTVKNFVSLAEGKDQNPEIDDKYKGKPFYNGLKFHRVITNFMLQGGCPLGTGTGGPGYKFKDEIHPELKHDRKGLLSMANSGPNSNGSQFFVTTVPTEWLDGKHAIFGEVVEGYDIVEKISALGSQSGATKKEVKINTLTIERK